MPYADLHVHTTRSDGTLEPGAVPAAARRAGLGVVAITDHDRLPPAALSSERDGPEATASRESAESNEDDETPIRVVPGIELRVETPDDDRIDLLGYGLERTPELAGEIERLQADRQERARRMVERVEDRLGIELSLSFGPGVGRPHVARAIVAHPDTDLTRGDVFAELIGDDGPCYVAREVPDLETGVAILREACPIVSLAHPLRYDDPGRVLAFADRFDAIEREYPYGGPVDSAPVLEAIAKHDLLATGGSDAHGETLGAAGLTRSEWRPIAAALGGDFV